MARKKRKRKQNTPLPVHQLFKLIGAIILLFTFLLTAALVGAWLYFEMAARKYRGVAGRRDFRLSPPESKKLDDLRRIGGRIDRRLYQIRELRSTLPLRTDGAFDGRNREGRALNVELQELRANHERCSAMIDDLSSREDRRFRRWATIRSGLLASRCAMTLIPALLAALWILAPAPVASLSLFIERQTGLAPLMGVESLYGMLVTAVWIAFAAFLMLWSACRFALSLQPE